VLFELGIALGLQRVIIPVVEKREAVSDCPFWLKRLNVGSYDTDAAITELTNSMYEHLVPRAKKVPKLPDPIPHLTACIGTGSVTADLPQRLKNMVLTEGAAYEELDRVTKSNYEKATQVVGRSRALVLVMDGTPADSFASFSCGLAVAHPSAGYGQMSLPRRVLVLATDKQVTVPDSLCRCQDLVKVVESPEELLGEVSKCLSELKQWQRSRKR